MVSDEKTNFVPPNSSKTFRTTTKNGRPKDKKPIGNG